jgi:DNA repair protein RecO (recombination protein O)
MTLPRTYRAVGLTLRKRIAGEADVISTLLTREHGKLEVVARGARRLTSKLMGHLEPLTLLRVSLARGRSLDVISEAEVITAFQSVKNDYQTTARALYVAELADGFSATEAPNPELFSLTLQTLESVATHPTSDLRLRYFDLHLLNLSGFLPELYCCINCGAELEPEKHRFAAGAGGTLCLTCTPTDVLIRPLSLPALKVLRLLHRTVRPAELPDIVVPDSVLDEVNNVLSTSLQYWLDRQVNSKTFLEATKLS